MSKRNFEELPNEIFIHILSYLLTDLNYTNYFISEEFVTNNDDNDNDSNNDDDDETKSFIEMSNFISDLNNLKTIISFSLINKNIYYLFRNNLFVNENYLLNFLNCIFKFYFALQSKEIKNSNLIYGDLPNEYYLPLLELQNLLLNKERGTIVNVHNELKDCRLNYNENEIEDYFFNLNNKNIIKENFLERIKKLKFSENEILKLKEFCNVTILDIIITFYLKLKFLNQYNLSFTMDTIYLISFTNDYNSIKKNYFPIYGFSFDGEESLNYLKNDLNNHLDNFNKIFYIKFINIFNLNLFPLNELNGISFLEFDFAYITKFNFDFKFNNVKSVCINLYGINKDQNYLLQNLLQKKNFPKLIDLTINGFKETNLNWLLNNNDLLKQLISIQISNSDGLKFKPIDFLNELQQLQNNNECNIMLKSFTAGLNINLLQGEYDDDYYSDDGYGTLHNVNDLTELYNLNSNFVFSILPSCVSCRSQLYYE
ncbi:hypothetical protein ABK040_013133 [Willaertia magna]